MAAVGFNWFAPGPRVPMPPPKRESSVPCPAGGEADMQLREVPPAGGPSAERARPRKYPESGWWSPPAAWPPPDVELRRSAPAKNDEGDIAVFTQGGQFPPAGRCRYRCLVGEILSSASGGRGTSAPAVRASSSSSSRDTSASNSPVSTETRTAASPALPPGEPRVFLLFQNDLFPRGRNRPVSSVDRPFSIIR